PVNVGITQSKNMLGCSCFVLGFFFVWHFLRTWRIDKSKARRDELRLVGILLFMIAYLLRKSHGATATLCLLIAIMVMFVVGRRWLNKKLIGTYVLIGLTALVVAELADRKSTRLNSSHDQISYAVFCLKKKKI